MRWLRALIPVLLLLPGPATAATLTLTPDKTTYAVGETITLSVFGEASGGPLVNHIAGRLLFDSGLATFVAGNQQLLTSFNGALTWTGVAELNGGIGLADAFYQISPFNIGDVPDGPLISTVMLLATAPGTLDYAWETSGSSQLSFFGLLDAPGGSVTIIPEPSTALLLALGLAATALADRRPGRAWPGAPQRVSLRYLSRCGVSAASPRRRWRSAS